MKAHADPIPHYKWEDIEKALTPEEFFDFTLFIVDKTLFHDAEERTCVPAEDFRAWSKHYATSKHDLEHIDWTDET